MLIALQDQSSKSNFVSTYVCVLCDLVRTVVNFEVVRGGGVQEAEAILLLLRLKKKPGDAFDAWKGGWVLATSTQQSVCHSSLTALLILEEELRCWCFLRTTTKSEV